MANKITKKDNFKAIMEVLENAGRFDLLEVMKHEIELLDKKASKAKVTKTQVANASIKETIIAELVRLAKPVTITELLAESDLVREATGNSNQKTSALITQLKNDNLIIRTQDKKKALFSVNTEIDTDAE